MSVLTRLGRFTRLSDDARCVRPDCGRTLAEHTQGFYGPPRARVYVLSVCPRAEA